LTDDEQAAVKAHGLYTLKDFLPKKPGDVELKVIKEMFEASVDGEPFDMERWGQYFKPAGMGQATGDPVGRTSAKAAPAVTAEDPPFDVDEPAAAPAAKQEAPASTGGRAEDILAMIRSRNKQ
jgi:hypothetical protein